MSDIKKKLERFIDLTDKVIIRIEYFAAKVLIPTLLLIGAYKNISEPKLIMSATDVVGLGISMAYLNWDSNLRKECLKNKE